MSAYPDPAKLNRSLRGRERGHITEVVSYVEAQLDSAKENGQVGRNAVFDRSMLLRIRQWQPVRLNPYVVRLLCEITGLSFEQDLLPDSLLRESVPSELKPAVEAFYRACYDGTEPAPQDFVAWAKSDDSPVAVRRLRSSGDLLDRYLRLMTHGGYNTSPVGDSGLDHVTSLYTLMRDDRMQIEEYLNRELADQDYDHRVLVADWIDTSIVQLRYFRERLELEAFTKADAGMHLRVAESIDTDAYHRLQRKFDHFLESTAWSSVVTVWDSRRSADLLAAGVDYMNDAIRLAEHYRDSLITDLCDGDALCEPLPEHLETFHEMLNCASTVI